MDKVIVDINKRCFKPHLCYTAFYVAISRVKQGADLRVLAPQPGTGHFQHLKDLVPPRELVAWMQGFDGLSGAWSAAKAKEAYGIDRATRARNAWYTAPNRPAST